MPAQNFKETLDTVQNLLHEGLTDQAATTLASLKPKTFQQSRMHAHFHGKVLMRLERFHSAKQHLAKTRQKWGDHIGIVADMAMCAYLSGQFADWEYHVREMAMIFNLTANQLSADSFVRSGVLLAKFHEELGEIVKAETLLRKAYDRMNTIDSSSQLEHFQRMQSHILANLLRISALFFSESRVAPLYRQLLLYQSSDPEIYLEVEHSLLLVEMRILGQTAALARLQKLWPQIVHSDDRRLIAWEYLEYSLRRGWPLKESDFLLAPENWQAATVSERDLLAICRFRLAESNEQAPQLHNLTKVLASCSVAGGLRYLAVLYALRRQGQFLPGLNDEDISQSKLLLLRGMDSSSQKIWSRHFEGQIDEESINIKINRKEFRIFYLQNEIHLKRKASLFALLCEFIEKREIPLADLSLLMGNSSYNESYYHRFRMQVGRLNSILEELTGVQKILHVTKDSIQILESVQVQSDTEPDSKM